MTNMETNSEFSKSKWLIFFEYIGIGLCLSVIALRVTFTEGVVQSSTQPISLGDNVYSLLISGLLISFFVVWIVWNACSRRFLYRVTAVEIGLLLFLVAAIVSGFAASNKRAAITNISVLAAPVLMGVLLVQVLDSVSKIKLVLCFIVGMGVVLAYQCTNQFFMSNQLTIEQYEKDPENMLKPLGITEGSFQHMLFEHRIYSKGVSGFFTNSNSAGSFAMLASFCAVGLLLSKFRNHKLSIGEVVVVAAILGGLLITQSKGAIAASVIAAVMFVCYLLFAKWLKAHKVILLVIGILVCLILGFAVIEYGLEHGRLPGGNSMLVRWQYWNSSARMYADHWDSGVGGGNFGHYYPHYKQAAALEVVADPHNFVLSILCQYGPLGLLGFLAMILVPLWRVVFGRAAKQAVSSDTQDTFGRDKIVFLVLVSLVMLCIRPVLLKIPAIAALALGAMLYVVFSLYIIPVIALVIGIQLQARNEKSGAMDLNILRGALFCGILGFLIHNLIDFAIFEVGVFTSFWAVFACLIALDNCQRCRSVRVLKVPGSAKLLLVCAGVGIIFVYFNYAFVPVKRSVGKIQQAFRQVDAEGMHKFLDLASEADKLDAGALSLNGKAYLEHYVQTGQKQPIFLEKASACFLAAAERDKADYNNYLNLSRVYELLGELEKAYAWCIETARRYPGFGRLQLRLAKIAEQLEKKDAAVEHYKKAIEIEDAYRTQFKLMYPGKKIFSRIGETEYQFSKRRLEELSESSE